MSAPREQSSALLRLPGELLLRIHDACELGEQHKLRMVCWHLCSFGRAKATRFGVQYKYVESFAAEQAARLAPLYPALRCISFFGLQALHAGVPHAFAAVEAAFPQARGPEMPAAAPPYARLASRV